MATRDAQMNLYLDTIAVNVYGKEIRGAIHDGMEKTYNDAYSWFDQSIGKANQAEAKAAQALEDVTEATEDMAEIRQLAERIDENYGEVTGRIDNIISHNNDTEENTELIDIRTTYQGLTVQSAGTAVRSQVAGLSQRINNIVNNNPSSQIPVDKPASINYELLWENEDPSSAFTTQTISFTPVDDTMELLLIYKLATTESEEYCDTMAIPADSNSTLTKRIDIGWADSDGLVVRTRDFQVGSSSIVVSNCQTIKNNNPFSLSGTSLTIIDPTSVSSTANAGIIPLRIYAVQHVIDTTLSVPKDSELIDARTGIDGTIYNSVGDAIRTQLALYSAPAIIEALNDDY